MSKTSREQNQQTDMESLPLELQKWCLSGQSVEALAHLVKNMIQTVSGSAEVIEVGLEKKRYDYVQRSWDLFEPNLRRFMKFVLDLIKYTRRYPVQKTACDLNQLIERAVHRTDCLRKKYDVQLHFEGDNTLSTMQLDVDRIEEMTVNLMTHAMDNLSNHTGTIHICTHNLPDHRQVQISVTDDGPCLDETVIRSLDMPAERTRDMCGTGFDIPLIKLCVEQHDGYMEFESTPEIGNCVHIYLPCE